MKFLCFAVIAASAAWGQSASSGTWAVQGASGPGGSVTTSAFLVSITVTPSAPVQMVGAAVALTATGTYSDGSIQNLTSSVIWGSANTAIASLGTLSTTKSVNCLSAGSSMISASQGSVVGSTTLTCNAIVTLSSVALTPANPAQITGSSVSFTATGTYSDGSTQNLTATSYWSSSNTSVATLGAWGNATLTVTCAGLGTSTIQATSGAISGNTTLTCSAPPSTAGENMYCGPGDVPLFGSADGPAVLPSACVYTDTSGTPAPGATTVVSCGSSLQTALNNASCGDKIVVPAMCSSAQNVVGAITLAAHSCDANHWIWVASDQTASAGFPPEHSRATPCAINQAAVPSYPNYPCSTPATLMPQIQCGSGPGCVTVAAGANYYRLIGLEIHGNPSGTNNLSNAVDLSNGADHIIFDRDLVHGIPISCSGTNGTYTCSSRDVAHGIATANSTNVAVINSWVYDILCPQASCVDATGVGLGGNGAVNESVKKLYNNLIAAAGENYFAGGGGQGTTTPTLTPNDFEIRGNHLFKPVTWAFCNGCGGAHPEFKNNGELKNANRVLIEGNVYENNWSGWQTDQMGFLTLLTPKNQGNKSYGNASSDGAGNLTAIGSTFPATVTSASCAVPGHCVVQYSGATYSCQAQTYVDSTHISVTNCSPSLPPVTGSAGFSACNPGMNPTAHVTNATVRFNDLRNGKNGVELGAATSDCGDKSQGVNAVSIHDNLFQGINALLSNSKSPGTGEQCLEIYNGQSAPNNIYNFLYEHNTCAVGYFGYAYSFSGLDYALDGSDKTGSGGSYMANRVERNNIGVAGGLAGYNQGGLYPNGLNSAIALQSCTPPGGSTCTWTYTKNVEGIGLWTHQNDGRPYPASNADPGDSPAGPGCGIGSASCHPSGSAFTSLFVSYNGPNGQTGYLGNYQLANGSPYAGSGTDGKDIGISDWARFNALTNSVRSDTTYTPASITTSSLPNAVIGTAYSQQLSATSASDFQAWQVISGTLPAGLSMSLAGVVSGTPTAAGTSTFTMRMMDAAQQYDSQTLSITVGTGLPSGGANWQLVATPSAATQIDFFTINSSNNHWFLADRNTGFWKSTTQGVSWTQINGGLPLTTCSYPPTPNLVCGWTIQVNPRTGDLIANTQASPSHFYVSHDEANWTQFPEPAGFLLGGGVGGQGGCVLPRAGGGTLECGGAGASGHAIWYSTDGGITTGTPTQNPAIGSMFSGGVNPVDGTIWVGTENGGGFCSTDGGATLNNVWALQPSTGHGGTGNMQFTAFDNSGNVLYSTQGGVWRGVGSGCTRTFTNTFFVGSAAGKGLYTDSLGSVYWGHNHNTSAPNVVYRSLDGGQTFSAWDTGLPQGLEMHDCIENANDGQIYCTIEDGQTNNGWVYRTNK